MLHATGCPAELRSKHCAESSIQTEPPSLSVRLACLDVDAWETLYVQHRRLIRGVLASHLGYSIDLEDVTQQVFETALSLVERRKAQLSGDASGMRAWLVAIALRLAQTERRRRNQDKADDTVVNHSLTTTTSEPEVWQLLMRTQALIAKLPERLRVPWLLRHLEGMQLEEVASSCGISLATTKRRLARAGQRFNALAERDAVLREHLQERGML